MTTSRDWEQYQGEIAGYLGSLGFETKTNEKVETLLSIVNDVGADRGLLVTERGFQSGAIAAARQTNVTTVTFESLHSSSVDEL